MSVDISERNITDDSVNTDSVGTTDKVARQRFVYGLALAYKLFNVVELVESVIRSRGKGPSWRAGGKDSKSEKVARFDTTPSAERSYISRVAALKRLSAEEEFTLATKMRNGDELARNLLVSANLGLVVMFAKKYSLTGAAIIDLVAEGNIALLQATRTFDPERGFRFSTYAKRPITQAMVRALPRLTGAVTVPMPKQPQSETGPPAKVEGLGTDGRYASGDGEGSTTNAGLSAWASLAPISDAADIPADEKHEPVNQVGDLLRDQTLKRAMACLKVRERQIVSARFGLDEIEPETLASLASRFEISVERVRQIESAGLKRLAQHLDRAGHSLDTML